MSNRRRLGRRSRRRRAGPGFTPTTVLLALVVVALVAAMAWVFRPREVAAGGAVVGTVVYTAPNANGGVISLRDPVEDLLRAAAAQHAGVRLVRVEGNGAITSTTLDMTPRLEGGEVVRVDKRIREVTQKNLDGVAAQINNQAAAVAGEALFGGLQRTGDLDTSRPVIAIGTLLDTEAPLDFRALAFDVSTAELARRLGDAKELPALGGASITFVVRPVAGAQEQLRPPQAEYREASWATVAKASGATDVRFVYPDGKPATVSTASPVVPIPPPPSTPVPTVSKPTGVSCTLLGGTYFRPDQPVLLDPSGTRAALTDCAARIPRGVTVRVTGFTAGTDPDNRVALELSRRRAQVVADLLADLGVSGLVVDGKGNSGQRPYPDQPEDPRNRAVVISTESERSP